MKLATLTLGCKVNSYDTEAMQELFLENGYELVEFDEVSDVYLINTCTVTNFGDKKSRQMIRKAKKNNPDSIVVVTGCYAQVSHEEVSKIEGVNLVIGTKDRSRIIELINEYISNEEENVFDAVTDIMNEKTFERLNIKGLTNRTRAYLKIQEGCNMFCSYCIIPYARGPIRSREVEDVLNEATILSKNGFKELVLAGIHVASYGKDLKNTSLLDIITMVNEIDGIERIRFSSIEPSIITEDFVNNIKNLNKVCHHMHLSLQSGSDKILKLMNRKYTTEQFRFAVNLLRNTFNDIAITTDLIVGFPDETEIDFLESYNFCKEIEFSKIHVFPFSPKKGTKAFDMKNQISSEIKDARSKKIIELDKITNTKFLNKNLILENMVLFENKCDDNMYEGHTDNYIFVKAYSEQNIVNQIKPVYLTEIKHNYVNGRIL